MSVPNARAVPTVAGVYLFAAAPSVDDRGFFCRVMDQTWLEESGIDASGFVQDSVSRSRRGVLRGMHVRRGRGEAKLIRCSAGRVFDAVLDVRATSPTFRSVFTIELDADRPTTMYVPPGCAHGFQALTDFAEVTYRIDRPHDPKQDVAIRADDPDLGIGWPLPITGMSQRDGVAPPLAAVLASMP